MPRRMFTTVRGSRTGCTGAKRSISRALSARPHHFDLSLGKSFAEKYSVSVTALNVANRRVQLDNSLTSADFTGTIPGRFT